ncbi:hypothetical protein [Burkholderia gladioli]|uniref:hypothetical protein n=1 Tax=Burkholderia gladioli TaxID=28095 RepID=UPI0013F5B211
MFLASGRDSRRRALPGTFQQAAQPDRLGRPRVPVGIGERQFDRALLYTSRCV